MRSEAESGVARRGVVRGWSPMTQGEGFRNALKTYRHTRFITIQRIHRRICILLRCSPRVTASGQDPTRTLKGPLAGPRSIGRGDLTRCPPSDQRR
eukprot:1002068-Prorocentrum_minimum.AAC.1